ncbi:MULTISPECIES: hypothetical protein [unclassified Aminobacter]|uniref:hypothetical protein n=1 Tax=unclassified Aminobacter TaxID=2644704 RepID=UPI0004673A7D|nr:MULTISPECIES: hypothetical protein [unclassified Aminobacter]TWH35568.1 hypothetical protein L611_001200000490 [Aminobacter sp. J15]
MANDKQKKRLFTFDAAKGVHLALKRPDTKYNEHGTYKANIRVPLAEATAYMEQLQAIAEELIGKKMPKKKNTCWYFELDKETEEETGYVIFKNEVKNRLNKKTGEVWDRRPLLIDADLKPVDVNPWGGSTIVVQSEVYVGKDKDGKKLLQLQPIVVQILELIQGDGTGSRGDMSAFKKHEGGFTGGSKADDEDEEDYDSDTGSSNDDEDADY